MKTEALVIGLGNEFLGDDGIGVIAARKLRADIAVSADVIDCNLSGVALLDVISGYKKVIFVDAIRTRHCAPGTVLKLEAGDFRAIPSDSPHHTGLAELINISRRLGIDFPDEIVVIAVEVEDCFILGAKLSESVAGALAPLLDKIKFQLQSWKDEGAAGGEFYRQPDLRAVTRPGNGRSMNGAK
jgi:hydrogenase maturation protease